MLVKLLLLFFAFSFLFRTDLSFDQDLGRHIKLGEIITKTLQIPKTNLFSYTNPDFPFINTHWLFEVITYWFSQAVGLQTLLILKVLIIIISVWLILKIVPGETHSLLLPISFIFLHVLRERLELRPEIFSFLFTSCTYFILEKFIQSSSGPACRQAGRGTFVIKLIFLLPLIQLIWVNTHIYFFIGLLLQVIFIIFLAYQALRLHLWGSFHPPLARLRETGVNLKLLTVIFILSVLFSLINPNGLTGFLYPLNVTKNYGYTIVENQSLFLLENIKFNDRNFFFVKISWGIIIVSLVVSLIRRSINLKNLLLSVSGLFLSLMNVRSFPYLVLISLPATIQSFGWIRTNNLTRLVTVIFAGILIIESFNYLNGSYYKSRDDQYQVGLKLVESAKKAMDYVNENDLPGPIFNNFDIGSYIIYRSYPKLKVFVDGRPEAFPKDFFSNVYIPVQSDYEKFKQLNKEINFNTIIFSHTDQTPWGASFLKSILKDQDWKLVFIDNFIVVLVPQNLIEEKRLKVVDPSVLDPKDYQYSNHVSYLRIGLFLLNNQYLSGVKFVEKAIQIYPASPVANSVLTSGRNNQQ